MGPSMQCIEVPHSLLFPFVLQIDFFLEIYSLLFKQSLFFSETIISCSLTIAIIYKKFGQKDVPSGPPVSVHLVPAVHVTTPPQVTLLTGVNACCRSGEGHSNEVELLQRNIQPLKPFVSVWQ